MATVLTFGNYQLYQNPSGYESEPFFEWLQYNLPLLNAEIFSRKTLAPNSLLNASKSQAEVGLPIPNFSWTPPTAINRLYYPTGASRYAIFWGILPGSNSDSSGNNAQQLWSNSSYGSIPDYLTIGDDTTGTTSILMYPLQPRPLSANNNLFLVPFVDSRWSWQFTTVDNLNLFKTTPPYGSDDSTNCTWAKLFQTIGTALGEDINVGTINSSYLVPDWNEFSRSYYNIPVLLDAAAASVNCRVVVDLNGDVFVDDNVTANNDFQSNLNNTLFMVAGNTFGLTPGNLPENVDVSFPAYSDGVVSCNGQQYIISTPTGGTGLSGTEKTFYCSCYADFSKEHGYKPSTEPDNYSKLYSLASQMTTDWVAWRQNIYDMSFAGVADWDLNGFDDYILIDYGVQLNTGERRFLTRVQSVASDFGVDQSLNQDPSLNPLLGDFYYGIVSPSVISTSGLVNLYGYNISSTSYSTTGISVTGFLPSTTARSTSIPISTTVFLNWNCEDNHWIITLPQNSSGRYRGSLGSILYPSTSSVSVTPLYAYANGQNIPLSTAVLATNPLGKTGVSGAVCIIDYNQTSSAWEITDVGLSQQIVQTNWGVNNSTETISSTYISIAAMVVPSSITVASYTGISCT